MNDVLGQLARLAPSTITRNIEKTRIGDGYQWARSQLVETENIGISTPAGTVRLAMPVNSHMYRAVSNQVYEPILTKELIEILDTESVFYDVGAYLGVFSKLANLAGVPGSQIHSFEGNRYRYYLLQRNLASGFPHVSNAWVGNSKGFRHISIDKYADTHDLPTVVKIDVEGAEADVLEGMSRVIENKKPHLYIEVHPQYLPRFQSSAENVLSTLEGFGYHLKTVDHRDETAKWCPLSRDALPTGRAYLVRCRS